MTTQQPETEPHWIAEVDRLVCEAQDGRAGVEELAALVCRETRKAYDAGVDDTERRLTPDLKTTQQRAEEDRLRATGFLRVQTDPPISYFAPATSDPAVRLEGRYRVDGPTVHFETRGPDAPADRTGDWAPVHFEVRGPDAVAQSPVRAYLSRHLDEATVELGHAEGALEDAERDHQAAHARILTIHQALANLDALEAGR